MTKPKQKLELTWVGKGEEPKLEPRILIENPEYSYGDPTPDFIVETPEFIAMVETKKREAMEEAEVQAKTKAALYYCHHATEYNRQISGKPWKYVLIPHDQVRVNMSLEFLLREWGVEG
jgi:type III restriction enzyme